MYYSIKLNIIFFQAAVRLTKRVYLIDDLSSFRKNIIIGKMGMPRFET